MKPSSRTNKALRQKKNINSYRNHNFTNVDNLISQAISQEVFPGAVMLIAQDSEVIYSSAVGNHFHTGVSDENTEVEGHTVYDIGNLSSVFVTTTILMKLVEEGRISLQDQVIRYVQSFSVFGKADITIGDLIFHVSGLAQWSPFYENLLKENSGTHLGILTSRGAREYIVNQINRSRLKYPIHQKQLYSDLGLILLGNIIEVITGMTLDKVANKYIFTPLGISNSSYVDLTLVKRRGILPVKDLIAPTENCTWRKKLLWGEVQDDNAWAMGGIAGHAGLFSTASDIHIWASELLKVYKGNSTYISQDILSQFWNTGEKASDLSYVGGWEKPNRDNNLLESGLSDQAVGFNSFTGCMVWLDPARDLEITFLSNRICPSRNNKKIVGFRPMLIKSILESI